jgi:hypothetical protein
VCRIADLLSETPMRHVGWALAASKVYEFRETTVKSDLPPMIVHGCMLEKSVRDHERYSARNVRVKPRGSSALPSNSGRQRLQRPCPLGASNGLMLRSKPSFENLVGSHEDRWRDCNTDRLGGFEVYQ